MPSDCCHHPNIRHQRPLVGALSILLLLVVASVPAAAATATNETATLDEAQKSYLQDPEPEVDEFLQAVEAQTELLDDPTVSTSEATVFSTEKQVSSSPPPSICGIPATHPEVRLLRIAHSDYGDGISTLAGASRDSARVISNTVLTQSGSIPSAMQASDIVWQWGQFIDHDIDLTPTGSEYEPIAVPLGDPFFDPGGLGGQVIPFFRSIFDPTTGTSTSNPRQQVNVITGPIDASNVYGSDQTRSNALRTLDGTGRLKTSAGDLLPYNTAGLENAPNNSATFFLAGDVRSNEQVALTSMHTVFVREHNYWAVRLGNSNPWMTGEDRFQAARSVVMAEMQIITFQELLPLLLGPSAIPSYTGYNSSVNANIANVFSTAAYRLGHTMLSATIQRLNANGTPIGAGPLALRNAFFQPTELSSVGVDPYMKGLASQVMQAIDSKVIDDVRNFLFGNPGAGGLDLASLNIQRGRDHGLPDYNTFRIAYGLTPAASFADISSDSTVQAQLAAAYTNVNDIDVWVGALAEDHVAGTLVGELLYAALTEQFIRTRDGDPCWYRNRLNPGSATSLEQQTLAKVIARNTLLRRSDLQHNVFVVP